MFYMPYATSTCQRSRALASAPPSPLLYPTLLGSDGINPPNLADFPSSPGHTVFNAFEGPPRILRLWGKGRVLEYGTPEFSEIVTRENITTMPGTRSVIVVDIHQVGTSCGYQVPFFSFVDYRRVLEDHFRKKAERYERGNEKESMDRYWALKNAWSMDGLPGMRRGLKAGKEFSVEPIKKMVGKMAPKTKNYAGGVASQAELHVAYVVIALLAALVAILAATHPAFEHFPAQRRMQGLLSQVTSIPISSLSAGRSP